MNKLFSKIAGLSIGLAMAIGVGVAVASNKEATPVEASSSSSSAPTNATYSHVFSSGQLKVTSTGTATLSNITWNTTCANTSAYLGWDATKGIQLGSGTSGKTIQSGYTISTAVSNFGTNKKVTKMAVGMSNASKGGYSGTFPNSDTWSGTATSVTYYTSTAMSITSGNITFSFQSTAQKAVYIKAIYVWYESASTPLTSIGLSGTGVSSNAISIGSSDSTAHTINVSLTPSTATDPKVNIAHQSGTSGLFTKSASQITCSSGSGSFTITGTNATSGTETFRISGNTETGVYVDLVVTALDDSATYWTVSFNVDGGSASIASKEVEDGDTFEFPNPGTKTHYSFDGWSSDGGNTLYDAGEESPAVDDDIEYTAYWTQDAQYTVTYSAGANGSGSYSTTEYGGTYTLLAYASISGDTKVSASSGYRFKNYTVGGVNKDPGDTFTLSATTTITVNFEQIPPTDTLTATLIGRTSYGDWSGVSGSNTDAVYAGNSTKSSNGAIQMRSSNSNSGIVTTASGGTIKSVTVTWSTTDLGSTARTLDVYAKTTAYSAATDLYSSSTQGTKIGSISYTNATTYETTLTITGDYTYVGVRSNTNALYLDDISFEWALPDTLESLAISGAIPTYTAGSTFSFGRTATAHYSQTGDVEVGTGLTFTLGGTAIAAGDTIPVNKVGTQAIVVTYTDSNSDSVSATAYNVTVNYKGATGIELNISEAPLSIGGTVSLTATVSDEYADPHDVSWASGNTSIATVSAASGTKTITVTGVAAGNTTITATANGYTATCDITVTADPILNLKDSGDNIINDETLEYFTGDTSVMIMAESENVVSPVFNWSNEDDSVVTIDVADEYCEVTIVGAGSSEVSVTVGALTRVVTFSVSQSQVSAISLSSSVASGEIWDGSYQNTLTLTPSITKTGNATNVINWSSSDDEIATVSSASTSGTAITVTGVSAGTATITARSAYTPATYAEYEVTVKGDGVETLSWTKRPKFNSGASGFQTIWAGETTLGDLMSQNGSDGIGVFTPSWKSEKSDTPSMGTGAHDVHIVLSDVGGPTSEAGLTPLTSSYVFQASDNGKYVVAFYEGKASTNNTQLTVTKWRSVIDSSDASGTITWSSSSATVTGDVNATVTNVQYTYYENNSMRLGTGSGGGQIRIDTDANIVSVVVTAKAYSDSRTGTLTVGDQSVEVTNTDYVEFDLLTLDTPTDSMVVSTPSSSVRINIQSIVINCSGSQQIGKTEDCLGLEEYIDTYLHMSDYTESQGWCKDEEHNYYGKNTETGAKYHFNQLNAHQRSLLSSNSAYAAEWARLSAWAAANGESLNGSNLLTSGRIALLSETVRNSGTAIAIIAISAVSLAAVGGYFLFRKKKED